MLVFKILYKALVGGLIHADYLTRFTGGHKIKYFLCNFSCRSRGTCARNFGNVNVILHVNECTIACPWPPEMCFFPVQCIK